jgi:hypothetical protein
LYHSFEPSEKTVMKLTETNSVVSESFHMCTQRYKTKKGSTAKANRRLECFCINDAQQSTQHRNERACMRFINSPDMTQCVSLNRLDDGTIGVYVGRNATKLKRYEKPKRSHALHNIRNFIVKNSWKVW